MPQQKAATLDKDGFNFNPLTNLDKRKEEDDFDFIESTSPSSFVQSVNEAGVDKASSSVDEDGFSFGSTIQPDVGETFQFGGVSALTGATSIVNSTLDPTEKLDRPQSPALEDIPYEPDENESQFLNSVDHQLNSIKANYYSLIGNDEESSKIMQASELENQDRGGVTGFIGGALLGILPTAVAGGLSLVAAPVVAGSAMITALAYYVTSSMGQAQREIYEYEQETGVDVPFEKEALKTIGYGAIALAVESLGFGSAKLAKSANPQLLRQIGKLFTEKEFGQASKLMVKELPGVFHAAGRAEAGEEGIENTVQNLLTKTYDESRQIQDGLLTSLAAGYGAGAILGSTLRVGAYKSTRAQEQAQLEIDTFIDSQAEIANVQLERAGRVLYASEGLTSTIRPSKPSEFEVLDFSPDVRRMEQQQREDHLNNLKRLQEIENQAQEDELLYSQEYDEGVRYTTEWETQIAELQSLEFDFESPSMFDVEVTPDTDLTSPMFERKTYHEAQLETYDKIANDLKVEGGNNIVLASLDVRLAFRKSKLHGLKVIAAKMQQPIKAFGRVIDVKTRWGGQTGDAMQNLWSIRSMVQNQGHNTIKKIGKTLKGVDNIDDVSYMISIVANDSKYVESQTFQSLSPKDQAITIQAAEIMRTYFTTNEALIKEKQIATQGFYEETSARILDKIEKSKSKKEQKQLIKELQRIKEDLSFVHIPYNLMFMENHLSTGNGLKKMQYLTQKERKTLTIQDIIEPIYSPKGDQIYSSYELPGVFNFDNVIASYADRLGKDVALANIVEAGIADGRIIDITDSNAEEGNYEHGFVQPSPLSRRMLKGKQVDKNVADWLNENTLYQYNPGKFVKVLNAAKHLSFLNPLFLGMYDVVQGLYGGSLSYKLLFNGAYKKAWQSLKETDAEMDQALGYGMESNIMSDTFVNNIKKAVGYGKNDGTLGGKLRQYYHQYILLNSDLVNTGVDVKKQINPLKSIYDVSFNTAWFIDSLVRRTSFYSLRAEGMSIKQAAEETALIHGKYASVPVKLRRTLNKVLYTPTFKIVMGKYFYRMTKDIVKSTKHYDDAGQKALETAFRLFALMTAQSAIMAGLGFEEEEFGRKYTRQVEDTTGKPQQLNITWSAPHNMFFKYVYRFLNTSNDPRTNPLVQFLKANVWELNPVWRVGIQVWGENRDPVTGRKITKQNIAPWKNHLAKIDAASRSIFPLYLKGAGQVAGPLDDLGSTDLDYVGDGMTAKELGLVQKITILPYNFLYLSDPLSTKYINQLNSLGSQIKNLGKDYDVLKISIMSQENIDKYEAENAETRKEQVANILRKVEKLNRKLKVQQEREEENRDRNSR